MIAKKRINALITARGGSKRLPNKNIKILCGKPLIGWTIEAAISSEYINDIYVSTDSKKIASISKKYGAKVPRLRPENLATDNASSVETVIDFAEFFNSEEDDEVILLQPTSPLRMTTHINEMMKYIRENSLKQCISVRDISKILKLSNLEVNKNTKHYIPNGSMYYSEIDLLKKEKTFYSRFSKTYLMDEYSSIDIDTQDDWNIAEACLERLINNNLI